MVSQVRTLMPNLIVVALKCGNLIYTPKIAKNGKFWYKFAPKRKFRVDKSS